MVSYASNISHPKHHSTWAAPAFWTPGLLSSTTTVSTLFRCGNSLSPHISCYPSRKSTLEGGRKVYVDLTTFVGPDPELYMTEYAAIRIVFTLQGLYTCTYSLRHQPTRRPTDSEAPVNETNGYGTILLPVWGASSRRRSPRAVKQSRMESPWILQSGAIVSCPLP